MSRVTPEGYAFAARVTTGFDGGNHDLHGDLWSCTRCGAVILPASRGLHDRKHPKAGLPEVRTDPETGALYATLRQGEHARTVPVTPEVDSAMIDVDAEGRVLGVELLSGTDWEAVLVSLAMDGRLVLRQ